MARKKLNVYKKLSPTEFGLVLNNSNDCITIDASDILKTKLHTWSAWKVVSKGRTYQYATTSINTKLENGKYRTTKVLLQKFLLGTEKTVKFLDGDFLNCRKSNLKVL